MRRLNAQVYSGELSSRPGGLRPSLCTLALCGANLGWKDGEETRLEDRADEFQKLADGCKWRGMTA
jgi:hypothetical protein